MNLDKAIEILQTDYQHHHDIRDPITAIALMRGIAALKRVKAAKISQTCLCNEPLPGETED